MKPCVFIHTNEKQMLGAEVGRYALQRNSRNADKFDVRFIQVKDYPFIAARDGQPYLRDGVQRVWRINDLQSFTPLRFMPPELMGYEGRALVIDPDVFAVGDIWELLNRDLDGGAIMCRARSGSKQKRGIMATSVMLLECSKLKHWKCEEQFNELFAFKRDYMDWIGLRLEPPGSIRILEDKWNDFDHLGPDTGLLHNTKRQTQPWKTGLPVDFMPPEKPGRFPPIGWLNRARRKLLGDYALLGRYKSHPDGNQEQFFFGLLRECVDKGIVTEDMIRAEMANNHVRHDAFEVLDRTPPLAA